MFSMDWLRRPGPAATRTLPDISVWAGVCWTLAVRDQLGGWTAIPSQLSQKLNRSDAIAFTSSVSTSVTPPASMRAFS